MLMPFEYGLDGSRYAMMLLYTACQRQPEAGVMRRTTEMRKGEVAYSELI